MNILRMITLVDKMRCEKLYFDHKVIHEFIWDFTTWMDLANIVQKLGSSFILLSGSINRYFKELFDGKYYE